eukprot:GFYU01050071.1.p1 GENE.GFYU01050071.1~~GFYU01050071.1.p1  ORF type:complete len:240 (-),score=79.85 GFYU01050071.1:159-842(-)
MGGGGGAGFGSPLKAIKGAQARRAAEPPAAASPPSRPSAVASKPHHPPVVQSRPRSRSSEGVAGKARRVSDLPTQFADDFPVHEADPDVEASSDAGDEEDAGVDHHDEGEDLQAVLNQTVKDGGEDLVKFHQSLRQIIEEEEMLLRQHFQSVEENKRLLIEENAMLLEIAENPDHDIETYGARLEDILDEKIDMFMALKAKLQKFREHLSQEENAAETLNNNNVAYY